MFFQQPVFPFKQKLALNAANEFQSQFINHPIVFETASTLGSGDL
jgi:hypothetical protein